MPFKPPKKEPQFADLKGILAQTKQAENPLYQVISEVLERITQYQSVVKERISAAEAAGSAASTGATKFATYHTKDSEVLDLPNSVQLLADLGIVFDDTVPNVRTIKLGPHAPTHTPGGTDEIPNVAWTNLVNTFTARQIIGPGTNVALVIRDDSGEGARIFLRDLTAPIGVQLAIMRFQAGGLKFQILDGVLETGVSGWEFGGDKLVIRGPASFLPSLSFQLMSADLPEAVKLQALSGGALELRRFDNAGRNIFLAAGFGDTPLDASFLLSGSIPDARLSSNVPLKNAANTFTQHQVVAANQASLFLNDLAGAVDNRLAQITTQANFLQLKVLNDAATIVQGYILLDRNGDVAGSRDIIATRDFKEKGRTVPIGHWIDFTPVLSADVGTAVVTGGQDFGSKYTLVGNTITVSFLLGITLSSTPATVLMTIPGGFTSGNEYMAGAFSSNGGGPSPTWRVDPATTQIRLLQDITGSAVGWPTGAQFVAGSCTFEIV